MGKVINKNKQKIKKSLIKAGIGLWKAIPMILGTVLLVSLIATLVPNSLYTTVFSKNILLDSFIGSAIGSISAGNPVTSYIIGGEMLNQGINLIVVTAFLVAWVTVGIIQFPAESISMGKKFALLRNLSSFILAILVAIITVFILGVI